ncbi:MAG TPA: glycosyltransferase [Candidatus Binatia bacterium]|jgi:glycosyltransferase involved in cell wall biosynthesis|nr:glycosyltransferase [Candidatus Binatia bacterium]
MPKVSVIIPTYNRRDFVREAIASVLAQTYDDFELLVVDDGSNDNTAAVVQEFDGVRYVFQPNRGVSAARNRGVALSNGEFLAFLDADDLWQPRKLAHQVAFFAARADARICQTEEIWLRDDVRVNPHNKHRKVGGDIFARSLELCLVSPSAVMLRRELFERVGGFDESLPACEDYDLWLRIAATEAIHLIETPLVIKRGGHADQLSRRFWGMDRFRVAALCKLLDSGALSPEQRQLTEDTLRTKCKVLAQGARKRGKDGEPYLALVAAYVNGARVCPATPSPCPSPLVGEGTRISKENERVRAC